MSLIANLGINLDTRDAAAKLRQFVQGTQAAGKAAQQLQTGVTATGRAMDGAGRQLQSASGKLRDYAGSATKAQQSNKNLGSSAEAAAAGIERQGQAATKASSAFRQFGGIIASIGVTALTANMVRNAASAEQLQLRLKLLSREYGETDKLQAFVSQSAKQFGQSQVEAAQSVTDVYARLRPIGISLEQIQTTYKGFNAVALASGASAEAASGAFLQLSQALGSGRLQGDEFRSIAEQVPGILQLVSKEMGVTVGQLKQLGSDGKITSEILINALAKGFEENKDKIQELLELSPAQKFKEFQNASSELSNAIGSELLPAITPLVQFATELIKKFGELPAPIRTVIAATVGLTAAVIALAPAFAALPPLIGAVQAALAGISAAGLLAAGPWLALAAGIGAATYALSQYKNESQRVAGAARTGTASDVVKARNQLVGVEQEISLLRRQQADLSGRDLAASNRKLASLRKQSQELRAAVAANPADVQPATTGAVTPPATAATTGAGKAGGGAAAAKGPEDTSAQLQEQINRFREQADIQNRIRDLQFQGRERLAAEAQLEAEILQINYDRNDALKAANFEGERRNINALAESKIIAARAESEDRIREIRSRQLQQEIQNKQAVDDAARAITDVVKQQERQRVNAEEYGELLRNGTLPDEAQRIINFKNLVYEQLKSLDIQIDAAEAAIIQAGADEKITKELKDRLEVLRKQRKAVDDAAAAGPGRGATDAERLKAVVDQMQGDINNLADPINAAVRGANAIGDAFSQAFQTIASGSASTKEVLADFFSSIGQAFIQMAAEIIAKQLVMIALQTLLKALGGAAGSSGSTSFGADNPVGDFAFGAAGPIPADTAFPTFADGGAFNGSGYIERYANGGIVNQATMFRFAKGGSFAPGVMGEAGPEAILPLQRTPSGDLGVRAVPYMRGQDKAPLQVPFRRQDEDFTTGSTEGTIRFESTVINSQEFVTRDEAERIGQAAASRGAQIAQRRMKNNPQVRRSLGIA